MSQEPFSAPIYITRPILPDLDKIKNRLAEVWQAKWLTNNGYQHQQLEEQLKQVLKVPYITLFNNGTIALIVACQCLRLSGEVITTPFTFPATPHVLTWNNIKPIFCDIDPQTMNIDARKIESMITPHTTGILGVHVFGTPCDVQAIQEVADRYGLKVVYDAAHAFGTEIHDQGIGNFGDITMFSFHATKLYHTAEGGALTMKNEHSKKLINLLKNFGIKNEEEVVMPGINGKMNEIQAVIGLEVLSCMQAEVEKRSRILQQYQDSLKDVPGIKFLNLGEAIKNSYQYFVIRINEEEFGKSRDFVYAEFKKFNVFTRKYFYPLCSEYTCYKQIPSSSPHNLPVAHQVVKEVLSMPFYGDLSADDVCRICDILKSFRNS
ncbi:MAG: DegT/DnrJ/EryC1/StrS family aminotransferase [Candidatus Margulisbacteria bacterium]|nr:DegT/DnrJ/EryC1/StrS family aminotransferase [Candidatus Margulisiibacteriota bacterium]